MEALIDCFHVAIGTINKMHGLMTEEADTCRSVIAAFKINIVNYKAFNIIAPLFCKYFLNKKLKIIVFICIYNSYFLNSLCHLAPHLVYWLATPLNRSHNLSLVGVVELYIILKEFIISYSL